MPHKSPYHSFTSCCNCKICFPVTLQEVNDVLKNLAFSQDDFNQIVEFVWNLPNVKAMDIISKRLLATVIVGIQPNKSSEENK